mmetsp:Transcript_56879/g.133654  ORF Transcript_56879/g.133654 Transcript_56879/m.133654 type:complete len:721 (+) Transcript_56879:82-2244(+)
MQPAPPAVNCCMLLGLSALIILPVALQLLLVLAMSRAKTFGSFGYIRDLYGAADASIGADDTENGKVEQRAATKDVPEAKVKLSLQGSGGQFDPVSPMRRGHSDLELDTLKAWPLLADKAQKLQPAGAASPVRRPRPEAEDDQLFDFDALDEFEKRDKGKKTVTIDVKPQVFPMGFGFNALDALLTPKAKAAEPATIPLPKEQRDMFDTRAMEENAMESQASTAASEEEAPDISHIADVNADIFSRSVSAPADHGRQKLVRIAVVIYGSRGDIEPFVALAKELDQREYDVRILTNSNLVPLCKDNGIEAVPVYADTHAVINRCGGFEGFDDNTAMRSATSHSQAWMRENPDACIAVDDALEDFQPHVTMVSHMGTAACVRYEVKHDVPVITAFLHQKCFHDNESMEPNRIPRPTLVAMSSNLALHGVPPKWQDHFTLTRPWLLHQEVSPSTVPGLEKFKSFLEKGEKPVAIGWGSMLMKGMTPVGMLGLALNTLRGMKRRGVILGGYAGLEAVGQRLLEGTLAQEEKRELGTAMDALAAFARTEVYFIASAPYEWLLPQCASFVTHGGVGSVTAAMRAGCPCVVTPVFGDQFEHAQSIEDKLLGFGFTKALSQVSRGDLMRAIKRAEERKPWCEKQRRNMAIQEEDEPGVVQAARVLSDFVHGEVLTGNFAAQRRQERTRPKRAQGKVQFKKQDLKPTLCMRKFTEDAMRGHGQASLINA